MAAQGDLRYAQDSSVWAEACWKSVCEHSKPVKCVFWCRFPVNIMARAKLAHHKLQGVFPAALINLCSFDARQSSLSADIAVF